MFLTGEQIGAFHGWMQWSLIGAWLLFFVVVAVVFVRTIPR